MAWFTVWSVVGLYALLVEEKDIHLLPVQSWGTDSLAVISPTGRLVLDVIKNKQGDPSVATTQVSCPQTKPEQHNLGTLHIRDTRLSRCWRAHLPLLAVNITINTVTAASSVWLMKIPGLDLASANR